LITLLAFIFPIPLSPMLMAWGDQEPVNEFFGAPGGNLILKRTEEEGVCAIELKTMAPIYL
jgi:hypothetical protein